MNYDVLDSYLKFLKYKVKLFKVDDGVFIYEYNDRWLEASLLNKLMARYYYER